MGNSVVMVYWSPTERDDEHKEAIARLVNRYGIVPVSPNYADIPTFELKKQNIDTTTLTACVGYEIGGLHVLWHGGPAKSLHTLIQLGNTITTYLQEQDITTSKQCVFHFPL